MVVKVVLLMRMSDAFGYTFSPVKRHEFTAETLEDAAFLAERFLFEKYGIFNKFRLETQEQFQTHISSFEETDKELHGTKIGNIHVCVYREDGVEKYGE